MSPVSPDLARVEELRRSAPEGPVVMMNLVKLHGDVGRAEYAEYGRVAAPLLEASGAETLYVGSAGPDLVAGEEWDLVILVRYPDFEAFARLVSHPTYREQAIPHREKALERALLVVSSPLG